MRSSLRRALTIAVVFLALVGLSGLAAAGGPGARAKARAKKGVSLKTKSSDCAKARKLGKACKIEFEKGDTLEGGVASGSGENIVAPGVVTHSSLIHLRTSSRDRIIRSAEDF